MQATLTELHRETAKIVRPVIHGQRTVTITDYGQPRAKISPVYERQEVTEDQLRDSVISDQAILDALAESRE